MLFRIFIKDITLPITSGFYRTDIEFGSGREKFPLIVIGTKTAEIVRKEKMKGMDFIEVSI